MNAFQKFILRRARRYADVVSEYQVPTWALRLIAQYCFDLGESEVAGKYWNQYLRAKNASNSSR